MTDSDLAPLATKHRKLSFDPTINAGHILTFVGFLFSGFMAYSTLDKRVAVIEQKASQIDTRVTEQDVRIKDSLTEIKQDLRDVKRGVDQITRQR